MIKQAILAIALLTGHAAQAADPSPWRPKLVQLAPSGDHFLVTLCWNGVYCRPWTFHHADRAWKRLYIKGEQAESSYDSAVYSQDQGTIVSSRQSCSEGACDYLSSELVLISVADGAQQTIKTAQPAYLPTIGKDGKLFYWALRSATQLPAKGTTPYPRRHPTVTASHDVFVHDRRTSTDTRIVDVNAQIPLAPPKVLEDGRRIVIAASQIRGAVATEGGTFDPWAPNSINSAILADITSGQMISLTPRTGSSRLLLDVGCKDSLALIAESGVLLAHNLASDTRRTVTGGKPNGPLSGLGVYRHAALDRSCGRALAIMGASVLLVQINESDSADLVTLPN